MTRSIGSLRSERGTASVEVMLMLPVFILLFHATFYLHGLVAAAQRAGVVARGCAWAHVMAACPDKLPALCGQLEPRPQGALGGEYRPENSDSWFDKVSRYPVIGVAIAGVFGEGTTIRAEQSAAAFMSSERVALHRQTYLVCNTEATSWKESVKEFTEDLLGVEF